MFSLEFHETFSPDNIKGLVELEGEEFALSLINYFVTNKESVDLEISSFLKDWKLSRLNPIDRNLIRLGLIEFKMKTADAAVIINEYINLGKEFGTENSGSFINGILDNLKSS